MRSRIVLVLLTAIAAFVAVPSGAVAEPAKAEACSFTGLVCVGVQTEYRFVECVGAGHGNRTCSLGANTVLTADGLYLPGSAYAFTLFECLADNCESAYGEFGCAWGSGLGRSGCTAEGESVASWTGRAGSCTAFRVSTYGQASYQPIGLIVVYAGYDHDVTACADGTVTVEPIG